MSFEIALTGLNAASTELGVIGNNVANSNTVGFKKSRTEFADVYAASKLGAADNAMGRGVRIASVTQNFAQGSVTFTDNDLDLAINGSGFFRMNNNGSTALSRAGTFSLDRDGYVVNSVGMRLTGYQADSNGNITGSLSDFRLNVNDVSPTATSEVAMNLNLDASQSVPAAAFSTSDPTSYNHATSTTVYDSLGQSHLSTTYFRKTGPNAWDMYADIDGTLIGGPDPLTFDTSGQLTGTTSYTHAYAPPGAAAMSVDYDLTGSSQYGTPFSVYSLTQNGFTTGQMSGLDIDESGVLFGLYTNGQSKVMGQVALANVPNEQGLRPVGDSAWVETYESGDMVIGAPGTTNLGLIQAGAVEESNVEITDQLVRMITAQRNFQANAQVISTEDQVTQTILNIR